jgi:hypothetical protein
VVGIILPGILSLMFLGYGFFKILGPEDISWDPFSIF